MSMHGHNSGTESARERFEHSRDLASFESAMKIKFFGFGFWIFCE